MCFTYYLTIRVPVITIGGSVLQMTSDPYNMEETDPAESGALDSCLWELQVRLACSYSS